MLPTARKFGQITQNSPNFKPQGREKFGPNFWPNFLISQILAENSPNYQSSVLVSIISTQGLREECLYKIVEKSLTFLYEFELLILATFLDFGSQIFWLKILKILLKTLCLTRNLYTNKYICKNYHEH